MKDIIQEALYTWIFISFLKLLTTWTIGLQKKLKISPLTTLSKDYRNF
jgi:hypothetical protein